MIQVYIWNPISGKGEQVIFPMDFTAMQRIRKNLGTSTPLIIQKPNTLLRQLNKHLEERMITLPHGAEQLDFLAMRVERMTEEEKKVFEAVLEMNRPDSMRKIVNLSCNIDKFQLFPEIKTEQDQSRNGVLTPDGYVMWTGAALQEIYDGDELPSPVYDRELGLTCLIYVPEPVAKPAEKPILSLSLPVTEEELDVARKRIGAPSVEACKVVNVRAAAGNLEKWMPFDRTLHELNAYARVLKDNHIFQSGILIKTLASAIEAELPKDMNAVIEIAAHLDRYVLFSEKEFIPEQYDFRETGHGYLARRDGKLPRMSEDVRAIRFFGPLTADFYEGIFWGQAGDEPEELDMEDLCDYKEEIRKEIAVSHRSNEREKGLAVYLDDYILAKRLISMKPTVEEYQGKLWGVLDVKSYGTLLEKEVQYLYTKWGEQTSDGWGEAFEQRLIRVESGELYVHFGNPDRIFIEHRMEVNQEMEGKEQGMTGMMMR